ncbi:Ca2+-binding RTX toxin-like protein [Sphingomonas naasensis]|uniref:calcium-binding protein n=1 Tax=Sphingomonas naasensis TaxID=1344951 RepID=UPI00141BC3E6|nr:calcium-binding protein [Sphingomonas naasensis]NIJ21113.1 Ca2+-binding RTX toxin-like protein [Sphingomonas naasensis]
MPGRSLTQEQINILNGLKDDPSQYYLALAGFGEKYGALAMQVTNDQTISGSVARAFAESVARENGIALETSDWAAVSRALALADYEARLHAYNQGFASLDLPAADIRDYHVEVFAEFNLPPEAWTAFIPLQLAGDAGRDALWEEMKTTGWLYQAAGGGMIALQTALVGQSAQSIATYIGSYAIGGLSFALLSAIVDWQTGSDPADFWMRHMVLSGSAVAGFVGNNVDPISYDLADGGKFIGGRGLPSFPTSIDWFTKGSPDDHLVGTSHNDQLLGYGGNDILEGGTGNDLLSGGSGADTLVGGAGDDVLVGGDQGPTGFFGAGTDTADYSAAVGGIKLTIGGNKSLGEIPTIAVTDDGSGGHDLLVAVERVVGSLNSDTLTINDLHAPEIDNSAFSFNRFDRIDFLTAGSPSQNDDLIDLSGAGRVVQNYFLGAPTGTGTAGVRVDLRDTSDQIIQQRTNWGPPPLLGWLVGDRYSTSQTLLRTANANTVIGTQYDDILIGSRGKLVKDESGNVLPGEGYSTLKGGAGNDFLASAGWESHLFGGSGDDTFSLGAGAWVEDASAGDGITFGIPLFGGVRTWWMEGNIAYWAAFASITTAFPVIGAELLYTASFFMDQWSMKFARYKLDDQGNLLIDLWGQTAPAVIRDYHLDLDTGEATGGVVVFASTAYSDQQPAGHSREGFLNYINLALKAGFGVGFGNMDPLVLDLDGDGYELSTEQNGTTYFEFDGDGFAEHTGWIKGGDGFLVRDVNANGTIDSIAELFGAPGTSGFTALAALDSNGDGKIDAADAGFASLQVWRDANMDGISQASELSSLTDLGIVSINLAATTPSQPTTVGDNQIVREGSFTRADGSTGQIADVALAINESNTRYLGDTTVSAAAAALPELTGFGNVRNLRVAATQDAGLFAMVSDFAAMTTNDLGALKAAAEAILYRWAGVDTVPAAALGTNGFDERKLAFLEMFSGYQLTPREDGVIALENIEELEATWADQLEGLTLRLVVQGPLSDEFTTIHYDVVRDMMIANNATALADLLHTRLEALPADAGAAQAEWSAWAPLLGALSEGMIRSDANEVRADYLFAQLVRAMDGVDQPLSLAQLAAGLGIANVRTGNGADETLSRGAAEGTAVYFGGGGTDLLVGGGGQDVYVFGRAIGHATINDIEPNPAGDRIRFAFLNPGEVSLARDGNDLLVTVKATAETVRVVGQFAPVVPLGSDVLLSSNKGVEDIQFADGTIFEMPEIMAAVGEGTAGVDHMIGTMHTDVLVGRASNDILEGGDDADMYVFNRGDGADTIIDQQTTPLLRGADLIVFGDDIAPEDLILSRAGANGENLSIEIAGGGGSVLVQNQFAYTSLGYNAALAPNSRVEMIAFRHYGEAWTNIDIQQRLIEDGTTSGDDTVRGFGDNDRFAMSQGNDLLIGMDGADTYAWGKGAGNDVIDEGAIYIDVAVGLGGLSLTLRADAVQFGPDIALEDLVFSRPGAAPDLVITNLSSGETLTVRDQFAGFQTGVLGAQWFDRIEWFEFADGSRISWQDVLLRITTGGAGADRLWGDILSDTLQGGAGNDILSGLGGGDIYRFNAGDGHDTLLDDNRTLLGDGFVTIDAAPDILSFGPGIVEADLTFARNGADIELVVGTSGDRVTLSGQDSYFHTAVFGALSYDRIEELRFADGASWTWQQLNQKVIAASTTAANDITVGFTLEDRFEASAGDDVLRGGDSADTYVFGIGSGHDRIEESVTNVLFGDEDTVVFGPDVVAQDVNVTREGSDLVLRLASGDTLRVAGEFAFQTLWSWTDVERFVFADGTVWTKEDVQARLLQSTGGNDHLIGFHLGDELAGGAGNDLLEGADGGDSYLYGRGDGNDVIRESVTEANLGDFDRVVFGASLRPEDLNVTRDANDLIITVIDTGEQLRIEGQFAFSNWFAWSDIEQFEFADGTIWTDVQVAARLTGGTAGNDHIIGTFRTDVIRGAAGDDLLEGGDGSDIYVFDLGDGNDEIREGLTTANLGEDDELRFGAGITLADLGFARQGNDLLITVGAAGDSILLKGEFNNSSWFSWNDVERFTFADGGAVTRQQIQQVLLGGTAQADHLVGFFDANLLDGGAGDDILEGGDGEDTYIFGRGYGHDLVREIKTDGNLSDYDTVQLADDILPEHVTIKREGDDLIIRLDSGDTLRVESHFSYGYNEPLTFLDIDRICFANGVEWSKDDILLKALQGTPGDDMLGGGPQTDILDGGAGDDLLRGEEGSDEYVWGVGYGHDTIQERFGLVLRPEFDRLTIHDVLPEDLLVSRAGTDMVLTLVSGETLTVKGQLEDLGYTDIEEILFDNGTVWSQADMRARILLQEATNGADTINGFSTDDVLVGAAGNDSLSGGDGNDLLEGGAGDDRLMGGIGDDTYRFARGDGHDVIDDYFPGRDSGHDILEFAPAIAASDVSVSRDGYDLVLTINGGDSVRLYFAALDVGTVSNEIEEVRFSDGTVWTSADLRGWASAGSAGNDDILGSSIGETLSGLSGNDTIGGRGGNDILIGGAGDDVLSGDGGDDVYRYAAGDGNDVINDNITGSGGQLGFDTLELGAGILTSDLNVTIEPNLRDFRITFKNVAGSILLTSSYSQGSGAIEKLLFADGTQWLYGDLVMRASGATPGDDVLYGSSAGEVLNGGGGNDTLDGRGGNDTLAGGIGNDTLYGGSGDDRYLFNPGDGQDTINEYDREGAGFDRLVLGSGILSSDIQVSQANNGNDIVLKIAGTSDQITMRNANYWSAGFRIDQIDFSDGTSWSFRQLFDRAAAGTSANDTIHGSLDAESLTGAAGNDWIDGRAGADIIAGGTGDDTIYGGSGDDRYLFNLGDGQDILDEYDREGAGFDRLVFGDGILPSDIQVSQANNGNDIVLKIAGTSDQVTMRNANYWSAQFRIDQIDFANGTSWSFADLFARATAGTPGNDTIHGSIEAQALSGAGGNDWIDGRSGNDVITGGAGDDTIYGGGGDDRYMFSLGDGQDVINEYDREGSGFDRLVFGAGISQADVRVLQANNGNDIVLRIAGTSDQLTMRNANYWSADFRIDQVDFADGTSWSFADLFGRAMAGTSGNDTIHGGIGAQTITAAAGDDWVDGRSGDDILIGGTGADYLSGGAGNDVYRFARGDGVDSIREYINWDSGWGGTDAVEFASGISASDVTVGKANSGNDYVFYVDGGADRVTVVGGVTGGSDQAVEEVRFADGAVWNLASIAARVVGVSNANDVLNGSANADTLRGLQGDDTINGLAGNDSVRGDAGNDTLAGQDGDDVLDGGAGNDILSGGLGTDQLWGGAGADRFVFASGDFGPGAAPDKINDFSHGEGDIIDFSAIPGSHFIGTGAFTNVAGELRYEQSNDNTVLLGDLDGDGLADFSILLTGNVMLQVSDFGF